MKTKTIPAIGAGIILNLIPALILTAGAQQIDIPGIFNTGVDDSGNLLAAGSVDPNWTITSSPVSSTPIAALVVSPLNKGWEANTASSQWINATGVGNDVEPAGLYIYTLTFSLAGYDPSTASILAEWVSDNNSEIYLNGADTGISNNTNGFKPFKLFSLTSGFVDGENTLQFYVNQIPQGPGGGSDPEGLQVDVLNASAQAVPEPATATLALAALSMFGGIRILSNKAARRAMANATPR
ncbi:MAG TPA: PEP-CTERM sorting domain-containing protein [Candidatus Sulfotelmatobacter sp.]|nr:PEP-CTERM sorting domain-containing protein [Candidatus Sulfotelmatobacter sp.]